VRIEGPNGRAILSVEDWRTYAPPKRGDVQWKDGRSAMELAKAWFGGGVGRSRGDTDGAADARPDERPGAGAGAGRNG